MLFVLLDVEIGFIFLVALRRRHFIN